MPELPEVETVVRGLRKSLVGRTLVRLTLNRRDLRFPIPHQVKRLEGQRITQVTRQAKGALVTGQSGEGLLLHLGMSGRLLITEGPLGQLQKHDHVVFEFDQPLGHVVFNDPRRFGALDYVASEAALEQHHRLANFGIDPTTQALSAQWLFDVSRGRTTNLKAFLLDQRLIAGLGNIYVAEALFEAGLSPQMQTGAISIEQAEALVSAIQDVLTRAIAAGGSSLRDYVQADGELGYFQHQWKVYGRQGQACGCCGSQIERIVQAGRSSFYCPLCQGKDAWV